jgi:hypothetical protein
VGLATRILGHLRQEVPVLENFAFREFGGARIWDGRCLSSVVSICNVLAAKPGMSFSSALGPSLRQAAHRIAKDGRTSASDLLAGHRQQAVQRCAGRELILAVQDTTEFEYTSHKSKAGLGPLRNPANRGLMAHTILAVDAAGVPLGVLGASIWARDPEQVGKRKTRNQRTTAQKESKKWIEGLQAVEECLPAEQPVLIIADREADLFAYLAWPRRSNTHLLVRACRPRRVEVGSDGVVT